MLKSLFISLAIIYCLMQQIFAACSDTKLYCFDSKDERLGAITVGQCWKWSRLSCQPCEAHTTSRIITYNEYIYHCKHHYPQSIQVLNTKSVRANIMRHLLNEMIIGKK